MQSLPLFPLNTVLFPGMPISLHIFEERYKLMISQCIQDNRPFGVVLLKAGSEVEGLGPAAVPHMIGCTAMVTQVQPVGLGRMNIIGIGQQRFRVRALHRNQPYLIGDVEFLETEDENAPATFALAAQLRPWVERYLRSLANIENFVVDTRPLPEEPLHLGYLAAALLKPETFDKQALLGINSAIELLQQVTSLYKKEVTLMRILSHEKKLDDGVFSLN